MNADTIPSPSSEQPKTVSHILGEITWLLSQSPLHKNLFISDLEWFVMPAILLEQFRLYPGPNGQPAGLILWASVSEEVQARLENNQPKLAPQDWKSGPNLWLIEMVAPFGGQEEMIAEASATIFRGQPFKYQVAGSNGVEVVVHKPTVN